MVCVAGTGKYDLSIMASLNCNLYCPHCQYDAGPNKTEWLNKATLERFLRTVDWNDINSTGFYGGEISINLERWAPYIRLAANRIPCWCITNGSWSKDKQALDRMCFFARHFDLTVFISTTPGHRAHQDVDRLRYLASHSDRFCFKKDDTKSQLLPMGRNHCDDWTCTRRCEKVPEKPKRLAVLPNADIIFQSCDGVYPTIGSIARASTTWTEVKTALSHLRCPVLTAKGNTR